MCVTYLVRSQPPEIQWFPCVANVDRRTYNEALQCSIDSMALFREHYTTTVFVAVFLLSTISLYALRQFRLRALTGCRVTKTWTCAVLRLVDSAGGLAAVLFPAQAARIFAALLASEKPARYCRVILWSICKMHKIGDPRINRNFYLISRYSTVWIVGYGTITCPPCCMAWAACMCARFLFVFVFCRSKCWCAFANGVPQYITTVMWSRVVFDFSFHSITNKNASQCNVQTCSPEILMCFC